MSDFVALLLAGLAHQRAGDAERAEFAYRAVLDAAPDEPHALHCMGLLMLAAGDCAQAVGLLSRASAAMPDHDALANALGRALLGVDRIEDAAAHFQAMAEPRPCCAWPRAGLALARLRGDDPAGALRAADAALECDDACGDAWFARGTALSGLRRPEAAVAALGRAVAFVPDHAEAHLNLGNAFYDLDRREDAERHMRAALALDANLAEAQASLGCLLSGDGRLAEAVACCAAAIALRPDFAQAHWNQSFAYLLAGDYARGWEKYEWRKRHDLFARHLMVLPGREWQGEALPGLRLLVRAEQGLGDTIQFARYLPLLAARGARVVLFCAEPLRALLRQWAGVEIVSSAGALPDYDLWVDQMSLPRLFGTRVETIPGAAGYLRESKPSPLPLRGGLGDGWRPHEPRPQVPHLSCPGLTRASPKPSGESHSAPAIAGSSPAMTVIERYDLGAGDAVLAPMPPNPSSGRGKKYSNAVAANHRVGVVWAGNPAHSNDARRSMPIEALAPLLAIPNCHFVSLQVGPDSAAITTCFGLPDNTEALPDLAHTAALIATLDLVVSVDSCVAHLAGAMGRPVWILLPFAPDWRWMIQRPDSPWYRSARLFRQARPGDWAGPVCAAARELAALVAVRLPAWSRPPREPCAPASRSRRAASRSLAPG